MAAAASASTDVQRRIAARGSIYAHAGQIMLRYFNHEHNREDVELGEIRNLARNWCKQYFKVPTFRDVRSSPKVALQLMSVGNANQSPCNEQLPLHNHPKINRQYGTGEPLSCKFESFLFPVKHQSPFQFLKTY